MTRAAVSGEMLVDQFASGLVVGGAPFNVARHLAAFGQPLPTSVGPKRVVQGRPVRESGIWRKEIMASRLPFPGGCPRPDRLHVAPFCHACLFS